MRKPGKTYRDIVPVELWVAEEFYEPLKQMATDRGIDTDQLMRELMAKYLQIKLPEEFGNLRSCDNCKEWFVVTKRNRRTLYCSKRCQYVKEYERRAIVKGD